MIGYMGTVFVVYVDMDDAKTVTKLWSDRAVRKKRGKAETKIYQDLSELERDLKAGKVDMAIMVANEFVDLRNRAPSNPSCCRRGRRNSTRNCISSSGRTARRQVREGPCENKTFVLQKRGSTPSFTGSALDDAPDERGRS
ncbi:MAG: hypothetical protein MZV70_16735 [Desulfobacterales bacterium]|nr:hypothetical protein [Desulfobacterales bacterium]